MRITFEPAARDEFDEIFNWIAKDNRHAASGMIARIEAKVMRLAAPEMSHMGRPGLVDGTRELLEWPYVIVYKVDEVREEIIVVSVVHGARYREGEREQGRKT